MDDALIACRAIQFASAMLAFGGAAFRLYAKKGSDRDALATFDVRFRGLLLVVASVALLSGLALVPIIGGTMAGSVSAAFDWETISGGSPGDRLRTGLVLAPACRRSAGRGLRGSSGAARLQRGSGWLSRWPA